MISINILFLTIGRLSSTTERNIYMDLMNEFKSHNHSVFIVSPIERREKTATHLYEENGVHFLRVRTGNLKKNKFIEKGINTILIESLYKKAIKKYYRKIKFDLILYSTPPITFANVISYIKKRDNAKTYLLLKDIFPQNAIDLKLFRENSYLHKYFRKKEKYLYEISDVIGCMSDANVRYILEHNKGVSQNKIEVNPNSIKPVELSNSSNEFLFAKYNIPKNKVKFIYGGSLGQPQGIPFLIKCLMSNLDNSNVHFIIVGSGTQEKLLKDFYKDNINKNITFINFLPKKEYEKLVSIADVGMIFLDSKFTIPNFPSRLLSYMEAELPILAVTDEATDIGDIVSTNRFGYKCYSNNLTSFNESLKYFYNSLNRLEMGKKGRDYLEKNFTVETSYNVIMKHFK